MEHQNDKTEAEAWTELFDAVYAKADAAIEAGNAPLNVFGNLAERAIASFIVHALVKYDGYAPIQTISMIQNMIENMGRNGFDRVGISREKLKGEATEQEQLELPENITLLH
ncbi:hypothetical protein [Ruegeria arenilitoris]|uniref:hypothetical protein n=1 Tax=Ruegeria arenilitoris TaxID=1173585 RepID=UPI0014817EB6|nr:hypothetical protein [Ruegeria arenilitoris]